METVTHFRFSAKSGGIGIEDEVETGSYLSSENTYPYNTAIEWPASWKTEGQPEDFDLEDYV